MEQVPHQPGPPAVAMPAAGSDLLDFRIVAELGRGAFGRVYLARQTGLADRLVVLKVLPAQGGEAQVLAQLLHPNIVPIYATARSRWCACRTSGR
jgi:serine/threonine protein kinase